MKTKLLIFALLILNSASAFAQTTLTQIDPDTGLDVNTFLALGSGPGYVTRDTQYGMYCTMLLDGKMEYSFEKRDVIVKHWTAQVPASTLTFMKKLIEESRNAVVSAYQSYSGDAPGYDFSAYPSHPKLALGLHAEDKDLTRKSKSARKLLRLMSGMCGMRKEISRMEQFERETRKPE